jgi:tetratricopeptide (TPR) repeat protein
MIERLLAAESALGRGELEAAGRLFAQIAEADPRNAIAVVGLARIAARESRPDEARALLGRALEIDPDEAAARRLLGELDAPAIAAPAPAAPAPAAPPIPTPAVVRGAPGRPSMLDRLRGWLAGLRRRG